MSDQAKTRILTQTSFSREVLETGQPVLVDFYADWCAPCHRLAPTIEELAADFEGRVTVAKLNVDEAPDLAAEYRVRSIPSLVLFRDGSEQDRIHGVVPKASIAKRLEALLAAA